MDQLSPLLNLFLLSLSVGALVVGGGGGVVPVVIRRMGDPHAGRFWWVSG